METILVIEDHAIVREPLAKLLKMEGYRPVCAAHGNEAVAVLETEQVDLVLLDLMMPKRDGVSLLEVIRTDPRWKHLPVLVLTGVIEGSTLDRARELGVSDVLRKARFTVEELMARIRRCLDERATCPVAVAAAVCSSADACYASA